MHENFLNIFYFLKSDYSLQHSDDFSCDGDPSIVSDFKFQFPASAGALVSCTNKRKYHVFLNLSSKIFDSYKKKGLYKEFSHAKRPYFCAY